MKERSACDTAVGVFFIIGVSITYVFLSLACWTDFEKSPALLAYWACWIVQTAWTAIAIIASCCLIGHSKSGEEQANNLLASVVFGVIPIPNYVLATLIFFDPNSDAKDMMFALVQGEWWLATGGCALILALLLLVAIFWGLGVGCVHISTLCARCGDVLLKMIPSRLISSEQYQPIKDEKMTTTAADDAENESGNSKVTVQAGDAR
jgi:hypothetical protein